MAICLIRNTATEEAPLVPPVHSDGTGFRYCLYYNNMAEIAFTDTLVEALDVLIPGYAALSEEDRDVARIRAAATVAAVVQGSLLVDVDPASVTEAQWATLVARRGVGELRADWWTPEIPLVLVETAYQPYTEVPRPDSPHRDADGRTPNLWFISPQEDEDFLVSLHEVGYIRLMENLDPTAGRSDAEVQPGL